MFGLGKQHIAAVGRARFPAGQGFLDGCLAHAHIFRTRRYRNSRRPGGACRRPGRSGRYATCGRAGPCPSPASPRRRSPAVEVKRSHAFRRAVIVDQAQRDTFVEGLRAELLRGGLRARAEQGGEVAPDAAFAVLLLRGQSDGGGLGRLCPTAAEARAGRMELEVAQPPSARQISIARIARRNIGYALTLLTILADYA